MYEEQQTLIANFATFVADMQTALADVESYHVGVVTTDNYRGGGLFDDGDDSVNESYPECQALGGLVVEAQAGSCLPFAGGGNFTTDADDLTTKFNCIANVGENGDSDEMVGDAMIQLLASHQVPNAVSTCNDGFIGDDALLVIVILTDENDSSSTSPSEWVQAVVAAKGVADNAVVLSLIWEDGAAGCTDAFSETHGSQIIEFTEMFENHSLGNICDDSYAGFFSGTPPLIESACAEFEPEG